MVNFVPCGVCSEPIPASSRRYGGSACNTCASFFVRAISSQNTFRCIGLIANNCLKTPSKLGKGCQRCRYDKCREIGMCTNRTTERQEPEIIAPETTVAPESVVEPVMDEWYKVFATILDIILTSVITSPNLIETYLADDNSSILFANGLIAVNGEPHVSDKNACLTFIFDKFPITLIEFSAFIHFSLCKLEFRGLPFEEQIQLREVQNAAFTKFGRFNVTENRLIELLIISQHFLNVFYIFC